MAKDTTDGRLMLQKMLQEQHQATGGERAQCIIMNSMDG